MGFAPLKEMWSQRRRSYRRSGEMWSHGSAGAAADGKMWSHIALPAYGRPWLASQSLAPGQRRTDSFRRWVETHEDALFLPAASIVEAGPLTEVAHRGGAKVLHTIASGDAARRAVDDGADIIVAQGWEAGGHVHGKVATMALVPTVVDRVSGTPVIAAGGIADGRGLAAAMALGASGGWIGTRFPASPDAAIHSRYRNLLLAAKETDTEYGALFDVQWPDAPHRALGNATFDEWQKAGRPVRGKRPGEGDIVAKSPEAGKLASRSAGRSTRSTLRP